MPRRIAVFIALAVVLSAVFVRLGFWQLDRLRQRRERNAALRAHLELPAVPFASLRDSASYRRATLTGAPDYANEIVLTGRSREGSPGVYLITPVRPQWGDSAILVNRGWVYSPDAATVDAQRWHEARRVFTGYVQVMQSGPAAHAGRGRRALRALTAAGVRALISYPVASRYLVMQDSSMDSTPARLPLPALDDGPHLSYAIQWFAFAAIALIGAGVVAVRARVSPESEDRVQILRSDN